MEVADLIDALAAEGPLLAAACAAAGWDASVPGLDWDVRQLLTHVGGVHRWAADLVATATASGPDLGVATGVDTDAADRVGSGPADEELLAWFSAGHAALVATLRSAPADLRCATFLPAPTPLTFWARRQAHETAIHRADAEAATGAHTPFTAEFAQDGVAELLQGFAARRSNAIPRDATIRLRALDGPSWQIRLGGERNVAVVVDDYSHDQDQADISRRSHLVVTGASSDLYLWLWNRPAAVTLSGQEALAQEWAHAVRVTWS